MASAEEQRPGIRPRRTLVQRLDIAARGAFPTVATVLLMLIAKAPFGIAGQAALLPAVTLASIWFWSLLRPAALPPPIVFLIGILLDLLGWLPIGVGVLMLLSLHGLAVYWRPRLAGARFVLVWLVFVLAASGVTALEWPLTVALEWRVLPPAPLLFQVVLTASVYPVVAMVFARANRTVAAPEKA